MNKLLTGLDKLFESDKIKIVPSPKQKNKSDVKRQTHSSLTEHPKPPQHQNPRNSKPQNTKHKLQANTATNTNKTNTHTPKTIVLSSKQKTNNHPISQPGHTIKTCGLLLFAAAGYFFWLARARALVGLKFVACFLI